MNGDLRNLVLNLVAGLLMFVFGFLARQAYAWLQSRRIGGFWRPMAAAEFTLVLGRFVHPDFLKYEPSGFMGLGDLRAQEDLRDLFRRARLRPFKVAYADSVTDDVCKGNLILLGGVDLNRITADLMLELGAHVEWINESPTTPPVLLDTISDPPWRHSPVMQDTETMIDFGALIRCRNPRNPRNWVVVIAGCLGYGTWAGAQLTEHRDLTRVPDEFEFIYQTRVANGAPRATTSVTGARRLPPIR
jgi:hypothetical protein